MTNQSPKKNGSSLSLLLAILVIFFLGIIWSFGLLASLNTRDSILDNEKSHLLSLASALTVQTHNLLETIKQDLKVLDLWISQNPQDDPRFSPRFLTLVNTLRKQEGKLVDYRVVSETGGLFYFPSTSSAPLADVSDREYFLIQKDPATQGFHLSPSVKSRVTGLWGVPISYPISKSNHGLKVLFAALTLEELSELFENLRPKPNGAISLARHDSLLLSRAPFREGLLGTSVINTQGREFLASGDLGRVVSQFSPVDGLEKIVAYSRPSVGGDFYITCSVAYKDVLANWSEKMFWTVLALIFLSILVLGLGITLIKLMENLKTQNQVLLAATEAKTRFISLMSHEMRTPLNGVLGIIQILPKDNFSPHQNELWSELLISGNHLKNIINEILDWNKIESSKMKVQYTSFSLLDLIQELISGISVLASEKKLEVRLKASPEFPHLIESDPGKLHHILNNIVSNAIKFTDEGSVEIYVSLKDEMVLVSVKDTGAGIPPETLQRLFKPFEQGDQSMNRKYGGTGLGLAIAQEMAHLLGGKIEVTTRLGEGSCFCVSFPLILGQSPEKAPKPTPVKISKPLVGKKVLVVEDTPLNTKIILHMLEILGIKGEAVNNGQIALEFCQNSQVDLILMDIQMPIMDGYEATQAIRKLGGHWERCPIVALTAHALEGEKQRCMAAGMNDHLTKPINQEGLKEILLKYLAPEG